MNYSQAVSAGIPSMTGLDRRTTVRFTFQQEDFPSRKTFIDAVLKITDEKAVKCIQTLPGHRIDLTVRSEETVVQLLQDGIKIDRTRVRPKPLGFRTTWVYIHYLPSELRNEEVELEIQHFGRVIEVKRQVHEGTNIENGTRIAIMEINREIPSFIPVGVYRARVWHRGQQPTCGYCGEKLHFKKECPKLKDRLEQARIAFKMAAEGHNNNTQQEAKEDSTHETDNTTKTNDNEQDQDQDNSENMEEGEVLTTSEHGSDEESEYISESESTSTATGHEAEDEDEGETTVIEGSSTEDETDKDGTPQKPTEQQEDSKNDNTKETSTPKHEESS